MRRFILHIQHIGGLEGVRFEETKVSNKCYCLNWMTGSPFQEGLPFFDTEQHMLQELREWLGTREWLAPEDRAPELRIEWIDQEAAK